MNLPDIINGCFEGVGFISTLVNIRKILIDKTIKGVHWGTMAFFASWGYWNVYYYWHLAQWFSLFAGGTLAASNTIWVSLAIYYIQKEYEEFE